MFPAPQPENNEKSCQASPPEDRPSKQGFLSLSTGVSGALLTNCCPVGSPHEDFLLLHSAPFGSAQLDWVWLGSFLGLGWPPPPFHSLPAASLLALPVQHKGRFVFLPLSLSAPWPVAMLQRKMGGGTGGLAEGLSPQGLMLIPSQREAKWPTTGGIAWVFILKPRAPVII